MKEQKVSLTSVEKIGFLQSVLEAAENRRDGVENKASILIAANAILLAAVGSFFDFSTLSIGEGKSLYQVVITLLIATVICVILSILCSLNVLAAFTPKKRQRVMKVSKDEFNVFFVGKIAEFQNAAAYQETINSLTQERVVSQYTNQAFNLSLLVNERYRWFHRSQRLLILSIFIFLVFVITRIILTLN